MTDGEEGAKPAAPPAASEPASEQPAEKTESQAEAPESTSKTVGRDIAAAVANPGTTRARTAQRDQAKRNLDGGVVFDGGTTLTGDVIAGGQHIYYQAPGTTRKVRATKLLKENIDSYVDTYVRPATLRGRRMFEPVTILRGAAGSGRHATGLTMLNSPERRTTMLFQTDTILEDLATDRFREPAGYLLDARDGDAVTPFEVQRLVGELPDRDCVLIIIVSDRFRPVDTTLTDRIIDVDGRPDPDAVIREHLRWHGRRLPNAAKLLDGRADEIMALLGTTAPGVGDYAMLGRLLAEAAGDIDLVRRRLDMRSSHDFEKWFEDLPDLYTRCFAIALAVLNSLPHQAVVDAARTLEAQLDPKDERERRSEPPTPFKMSRRLLLDLVRASVVERAVPTLHGRTPAELVSFVDPGYPGRLLRYVWQEHDHVRRDLVDWLKCLGQHRSDSVRVAAATAVGTLAVTSFDYLHSSVLLPWATHEVDLCRESAAIALEAPAAAEPELRATVTTLVTDWALSDDTELAATAARSCGTALGGQDLNTALSLLDDLIVREEGAVVVAACISLAEWVGGPDAVLRNRGIATMHGWAGDRDLVKRTGGQLAFLMVAADLIAKEDPWPTLLRLATTDATIARQVVTMWSTALVNPELTEISRDVLGTWASTVDKDSAAITAFVDLYARADSRAQAVIKRQARGWLSKDSDHYSPRTAAAVLNAQV